MRDDWGPSMASSGTGIVYSEASSRVMTILPTGMKSYRIHLPVQETWVRSHGREDPLEKEIATHTSILAWEISWAEEPGGLQSLGSQSLI